MIRSGIVVFGSGATEAALLMLRNVVLARLLSVSDFGIAATFSILVVLMDVAQAAGVNRMIVQDRDGASEHVQASLHSVQALIGLVTTAVLLVVAWPFSHLMKTDDITWAYLLLAVVPLVRGFGHLDIFRLQREHRFGPAAVRQITPQLLSVLSVWPAYLALRDYRAALVAILVQQTTAVVASHVGVERRYRLGWDRAIAARAWKFGLPLILNGALLYLVTNGDRMLVANLFGLDALGWFSAAMLITLNPLLLVARTLQTLFLPIMARAQENRARLQALYEFVNDLCGVCVFGFVVAVALLGREIIILLYGQRYLAAVPLLLMLAIMQVIRLVRTVPALPAMAVAETANPLYTNLVRIGFIPLSLAAGWQTRDLHLMIGVGIVGEAIATYAAMALLQSKVRVGTRAVAIRFTRDLAALATLAGVILSARFEWLLAFPAAVGVNYLLRVIRSRRLLSPQPVAAPASAPAMAHAQQAD
ncbi:oligosaccharide flippase family protein [Novosphingobium huizhouense]|uniref:oligosaccharide flippase family protein n=1 Tax=Novosphingobium huizhouense TaxID=2866625 RepID=UPI001CD877AE|nr:oligosaccharide flippase family protein [Novosphingobium huizhouense]